MGSQRIKHDWETNTYNTYIPEDLLQAQYSRLFRLLSKVLWCKCSWILDQASWGQLSHIPLFEAVSRCWNHPSFHGHSPRFPNIWTRWLSGYLQNVSGSPRNLHFTFKQEFLILFLENVFIYFNWRIRLYNIVMVFTIHQHELAIVMCPLPPESPPTSLPIPPGCHRAPALGSLHHTPNHHWLSILHMVMYMFQCYSPKSSHLLLFPRSPKVCFLHLCLLCCPACRMVSTIFLDSIYIC